MPVHISLLRAINVGGHNKIKMDELRELYGTLGLRDVQTYIQSGNVVFQGRARDPARLRRKIQDALARKSGIRTDVALRTTAEWRAAMDANPFIRRPGTDLARILVVFLAGEPAPEARRALAQFRATPEELRLIGREIHLYCPNGFGKLSFSWNALDRILKVPGTGRNWNTVVKLCEMAEALESKS